MLWAAMCQRAFGHGAKVWQRRGGSLELDGIKAGLLAYINTSALYLRLESAMCSLHAGESRAWPGHAC